MFHREKEFNERLLALRENKQSIVKHINTLHQEYDLINEMLRISETAPHHVNVHMHPDEFPETWAYHITFSQMI